MKKGFTLIELIIVLVIVSLSLTLVAPSLSRFSKTTELKGTAQKIVAILRHARSEAIHKGKVYQVIFNPDRREIKVQWMNPDGEEKEDEAQDGSTQKVYNFPSWISIKEVESIKPRYSSELLTIEFYPHGGSNGGSFLLEGEDHKGYQIKVHFLTGMVMIEKA
ncbi:MAG: pilus assembly FimT family protein [Thermodesulfobacteriota bacterium]